jgi:HEAT repeat protein
VADLPLLQRLLADTDPRVRANTLEALWHMTNPEIEAIFSRALSDSNHRAVANAAYGLYLIDKEKYFPKVTGLIEHQLSGYRAAGAWLLGKIGDPRNLPMLRPLLLEKSADARGAAFRTLKILRAPSSEHAAGPGTEQPGAAQVGAGS